MALIASRPWITPSNVDSETGEVGNYSLETQDDTMLQFSMGNVVTSKLKVKFPTSPTEGQIFGFTTVWSLDDLELSSQYYPIVEPVTQLSPAAPKLWGFSIEIGKWLVQI